MPEQTPNHAAKIQLLIPMIEVKQLLNKYPILNLNYDYNGLPKDLILKLEYDCINT